MIDFMIRKGLSSALFSEPGVVNPKLVIEEGCLYLCTDTAGLFLGITTEDGLTLKRINEINPTDVPTDAPTDGEATRAIIDAFINEETGMLHLIYNDSTEDVLGPVVGKDGVDGQDGLTTAVKVNGVVYNHENGVITLPDFITEHQDLSAYATTEFVTNELNKIEIPESEIYKVDFNTPDYASAVEAYNAGKVLVLVNAAPDVNSYALMNYVSDKYITFTKFLMSRSETYGAFNTYYLKSDNTWEVAKEVKLNKVEITPTGDLQIGKELYKAPSIEGLATEEFVAKKIAEAELADKEADLEAYYTKSEVDAKIPSIEGLASEEYVDEKIGSIIIPDTSKFITMEEVEAKGYLTEHQSLEEYAKINTVVKQKYEVLPINGMFVLYSDNEVRVNTQHVDISSLPPQNAGDGSSDSYYYVTFRAYAPDNATSVIEGSNDKMDTEHSTLAIDQYGRKYTTIWAAIASKSGSDWSKFGDKSTVDKYLGFYYNFHWYNGETVIGTDKVRVILTNDACHNDLVPDAVARRIDDKIKAIEFPKTDLSAYYTKEEADEAIAEAVAEIEHPTVDLSGYALKSEVALKADDVPFTTDKFVTKALGGFSLKESVKGLTVAEIFAKLLGLVDKLPEEPDVPDEPIGIVENIIANQIPMCEIDEAATVQEHPYHYMTFEKGSAEDLTEPTVTSFYQKTENGEIVESGYQHVSSEYDEMYYMIALPKGVDFNTNVTVLAYDSWDASDPWKPVDLVMTDDSDFITQAFADADLAVPVINTETHKLWIDESLNVYDGSIYRFIINE